MGERKTGPRYTTYTPLTSPPSQVLLTNWNNPMMRWPSTWMDKPKKNPAFGNGQLCKYHNEYGHSTDECHHLKDEIGRLIRENRLTKYVALRPNQGREGKECGNRMNEALPQPKYDRRQNELPHPPSLGSNDKPTIHMIMGGPTDGDSHRARRRSSDSLREPFWRFNMYSKEGGLSSDDS